MRQLKIAQKFTTRDSIALEKYFKEISKSKSITTEEEVLLAKRIKSGDIDALEKLVAANLKFVISVSKQYEGYGMPLEDLISEGNIGLIKAARRFDETKGYKFISYAVFWIRQCLLKALNEHSRIVRLPANQVAQIQKIQAEFTRLEQEYGFEPTADAVSESLNVAPEDVTQALSYNQKHVSLDAPFGEDNENSLLNTISNSNAESPDDDFLKQSLAEELQNCLGRLNAREADVLRKHFGLQGYTPMMLEDIAGSMGLGRERVRQLKVQALAKLQRMRVSKRLQTYL